MEVWTRWLHHSQPFLFDVDDERALQLAELNSQKTVAVAEAKRSVQRATGHAARPDFSDVFNNQPQNIHRRPFSLAGAQANNQGTAATGEGAATTPVVPLTIDDESYDESYWMMNSSSEVLIAEIPKSGDRWKQANFDKGTFENYFGATCGENGEYRILLKNVDSNGKLGKTEVRPSVSVSSQNYRFELEAAAGLDYPNDGKRPICVFARIAERDFLYELIMPSNNNYDDVLAALNDRERPGTKMRRIVFSCEDVINKAPQLGILKRMEY